MEAYLHYIWMHRLYIELIPTGELAGAHIEVLDPGELNTNAGPDFFAAKIRINDLLWAGCVEIHHASAEWYHHHHDDDPAYRSVILHVVEQDNRSVTLPSGESLPTCLVMIPHTHTTEPRTQSTSPTALPCLVMGKAQEEGRLAPLAPERQASWLRCLLHARLREKVKAFADLLTRCEGSWSQAFYTQLVRYFGFGLNNEVMERLALSLPYTILMKHLDHLEQLEALLLGQAGLLGFLPEGEYTDQLEAEYTFLRHKYGLHPLPTGAFRRARTRPTNLPERRLIQLASLLHQSEFLADRSLHLSSLEEAYELLRQPLPGRWSGWRMGAEGRLTREACDLLVINVLIPYRLAYSHHYADEAIGTEALRLLEELPAENNRITRLFRSAGLQLDRATESQAVLHLHRTYCSRGECQACPWSNSH